MSWQSALFFNIFFGTLRGSLAKKLVKKIDPFIMVFHMVYLSIPLYIIYYYFSQQSILRIFPEMMVLGVIFYLGYVAYLYATKISLSKSVVYSSYFLIITLSLTVIFLGEWKLFDPGTIDGIKNILGIILAAFSLYIIFHTDRGKEKLKDFRWFGLISINILTNGIGSFWAKTFLISHVPVEALFSQTIGIFPVSVAANKIMGKNIFKITASDYLLIAVNSIFDFSSLIFYYHALKNGPAILVIPISTLALTIAITFAGLIVFHESRQFSMMKFAGLILGIVGICLLVI